MKTFKWKTVTLATVVMVIAALGVSDFAFAGNSASSDKTRSIKHHKQAINTDVVRIQQQQNKIELLKKQCRDERAKGVKPVVSQSELLKARADLKREKAYLAADKKALMAQHREVIAQRQKAVNKERAELLSAKANLFAALFKVKASNVADAQTVVDASHDLKQRETALRTARQSRNEDLLAVNKDIREANGQNLLVLTAEDGAAKLQTLALK